MRSRLPPASPDAPRGRPGAAEACPAWRSTPPSQRVRAKLKGLGWARLGGPEGRSDPPSQGRGSPRKAQATYLLPRLFWAGEGRVPRWDFIPQGGVSGRHLTQIWCKVSHFIAWHGSSVGPGATHFQAGWPFPGLADARAHTRQSTPACTRIHATKAEHPCLAPVAAGAE